MTIARLRSDIWVAAYLRRASVEGAYPVLRRRGAAEAGAVFVLVDKLDRRVALFAPGPADERDGARRWFRAHADEWVEASAAEARLAREIRADPDIWIVEVESRDGRHWLDLVPDIDVAPPRPRQ